MTLDGLAYHTPLVNLLTRRNILKLYPDTGPYGDIINRCSGKVGKELDFWVLFQFYHRYVEGLIGLEHPYT